MGFILLLIFITLSIAGTAAVFSVYGLAQLFSGAFYPVIVMGASLEAGKLVTASFLYRYWKILSFAMKSYLILAVFILMVITSIGIFGFLTKSYLSDTASLGSVQYELETITREQDLLIKDRDAITVAKTKATTNIVDISDNTKRWMYKGKDDTAKVLDQKYATITTKIQENDAAIGKLKEKLGETQAHVGPIVYVAKAFGASIDDATKYMVLILITVFDPLAVALTIGCNLALKDRTDQKDRRKIFVIEDEVIDDPYLDDPVLDQILDKILDGDLEDYQPNRYEVYNEPEKEPDAEDDHIVSYDYNDFFIETPSEIMEEVVVVKDEPEPSIIEDSIVEKITLDLNTLELPIKPTPPPSITITEIDARKFLLNKVRRN